MKYDKCDMVQQEFAFAYVVTLQTICIVGYPCYVAVSHINKDLLEICWRATLALTATQLAMIPGLFGGIIGKVLQHCLRHSLPSVIHGLFLLTPWFLAIDSFAIQASYPSSFRFVLLLTFCFIIEPLLVFDLQFKSEAHGVLHVV